MPFVEVDSLSRRYGRNFCLENISITLDKGEIVTLLGPSGSGKTSLLRNICGLDSPDSGKIVVNNRDLTRIPTEKRNIGMIFQDLALFPHLTSFENIAFGLRSLRLAPDQIRSKVKEMSELLSITEVLERKPGKISGGQRQRVALARSIIVSPDLLLMDEPLNSLDPELRLEVRNEIKLISSKLGLSIIYVTHDVHEGLYLGNRVGMMFDGKLLRTNTPKKIFLNPGSQRLARFFGYNLINLNGEPVGIYPSDFEIVRSSPDMTGIVTAIGFEGDHYRIYLNTGNDNQIQALVPVGSVQDPMNSGNKISLRILRSVPLRE